MWWHILNFELRIGFKKTSVLIYFAVFFGLAFLIVNILGGAFTGARIIVGNANNNLNAPLVIAMLQNIFCISLEFFADASHIRNPHFNFFLCAWDHNSEFLW